MSDTDRLFTRLLDMPTHQYSDLVKRVDAERRKVIEREEHDNPPRPGMTRDEMAHWIGRHHYAIDRGITQIFYVPTDAPPDEIRLLEINELLLLPESSPVEAVDFMPDIEGNDYGLFVADITPQQWQAVEEHRLSLPAGWNLARRRPIARQL